MDLDDSPYQDRGPTIHFTLRLSFKFVAFWYTKRETEGGKMANKIPGSNELLNQIKKLDSMPIKSDPSSCFENPNVSLSSTTMMIIKMIFSSHAPTSQNYFV